MCGIAGFLGGRAFHSGRSVVDRTRNGGRRCAPAGPTMPGFGSTVRPRSRWPTGGWPSSIRRRPAASRCSLLPGEASSYSMARSTTTSTSGGRIEGAASGCVVLEGAFRHETLLAAIECWGVGGGVAGGHRHVCLRVLGPGGKGALSGPRPDGRKAALLRLAERRVPVRPPS